MRKEWVEAGKTDDWIADAWLRIREEGHVFVGELLVVPAPGTDRLVVIR